VLIYNFATVPFQNQQELAWAASFILVLMVLLTSMISRLATAQSLLITGYDLLFALSVKKIN